MAELEEEEKKMVPAESEIDFSPQQQKPLMSHLVYRGYSEVDESNDFFRQTLRKTVKATFQEDKVDERVKNGSMPFKDKITLDPMEKYTKYGKITFLISLFARPLSVEDGPTYRFGHDDDDASAFNGISDQLVHQILKSCFL